MAYITLHELKRHLNIEQTYTDEENNTNITTINNDDDPYLQDLIQVVSIAIANHCNGGLSQYTDQNIPMPVKQAALLLAGLYFTTRTPVSFAKGEKIPMTFEFLLDPYKIYSIY